MAPPLMFADIISDLSIQTNNIYLAVERQLTTVNWKIKPDEEDQEQEQEATDHAHEEENEEKGEEEEEQWGLNTKNEGMPRE